MVAEGWPETWSIFQKSRFSAVFNAVWRRDRPPVYLLRIDPGGNTSALRRDRRGDVPAGQPYQTPGQTDNDHAHADQQRGSERGLGRDPEPGQDDDKAEFAHPPPGERDGYQLNQADRGDNHDPAAKGEIDAETARYQHEGKDRKSHGGGTEA